VTDRPQQSRSSVAILHVRPVNENEEHQPKRVGHDVTLGYQAGPRRCW
jgi:hypothetical protein